jgi:hypothetical protein
MLGRLIVGAVAAGLAWKYRDSIRDYIKGGGAAHERIDALLGTVQEKSERLLDQAKGQLSSRIAKTRENLRAGVSDESRGKTGSTSTSGGTEYVREDDRAWTPRS